MYIRYLQGDKRQDKTPIHCTRTRLDPDFHDDCFSSIIDDAFDTVTLSFRRSTLDARYVVDGVDDLALLRPKATVLAARVRNAAEDPGERGSGSYKEGHAPAHRLGSPGGRDIDGPYRGSLPVRDLYV